MPAADSGTPSMRALFDRLRPDEIAFIEHCFSENVVSLDELSSALGGPETDATRPHIGELLVRIGKLTRLEQKALLHAARATPLLGGVGSSLTVPPPMMDAAQGVLPPAAVLPIGPPQLNPVLVTVPASIKLLGKYQILSEIGRGDGRGLHRAAA